jgi:hypothetical protein
VTLITRLAALLTMTHECKQHLMQNVLLLLLEVNGTVTKGTATCEEACACAVQCSEVTHHMRMCGIIL